MTFYLSHAYNVFMFSEKLKELMAAQDLTARGVCERLNARGVNVSLSTVCSWMQGRRQPKDYVQEAILQLLAFTS